MPLLTLVVFVIVVVFSIFVSHSLSCTFTITNNCPDKIWPATLAGAGTPQLPTTGFQLNSGQSATILASLGWSGRIWARTGCTFDSFGAGACQTGDCGGKLECDGMAAAAPTTLFEVTLGKGDNDDDFYDVSLVDGYNLPIMATPRALQGGCNATGCTADLNSGCPKELQVVEGEVGVAGVVACKSACEAFGLDEYCCSGEYANPSLCRPSLYSVIFKRACPRAYSYAFDDRTSTFTCKAYAYTITFCPTINRSRRSHGLLSTPQQPLQGQDDGSVGVVSSSSLLSIHISFLYLVILYF